MPIGLDGLKLADDVLAPDLIEDSPFKIQHFKAMPFKQVPGGQLRYTVSNQFDAVSADGLGIVLDNCGKIGEKTPLPDVERKFGFVELATMFRVCYTAQDRFKVPNDITARLTRLATRRLSYKLSRILDTGATGFPSLESLAGTVIALAGAGLTLRRLNEGLMAVRENDGYANAIMCNTDGLLAIWDAFYGPGIDPTYLREMLPDPRTGMRDGMRPSLHGVPIYINDLILTRPAPPDLLVSNIYFMVAGDSGLNEGRGVSLMVPPTNGGSMFTVRQTPLVTDEVSLSTINVDVTWPVGIAIGAKTALSMLKDVRVGTVVA